jgi:hypothetical protein
MQVETTDSTRLMSLCERLGAATFSRDADWRAEGDDSFFWERPEGAVSVTSQDHDGQPPYVLRIYTPERVAVDELASALAENDEPAAWNESLSSLYRLARRSALGADEIIDALMAALPRPEGDSDPY